MGIHLALFLFLAFLRMTLSQDIEHGSILVDGIQAIAETDDNFICATIDWWPHDKCDYNYCPWGDSSAVNLVSIFALIYIKHEISREYIYYSSHLLSLILNSRKLWSSFSHYSMWIGFSGLVSSFLCQGNPRSVYDVENQSLWWHSKVLWLPYAT